MSTLKALKEEIEIPEWCTCMTWDWEAYEEVPPACNAFKDSGRGYCMNCEHGEDCHTTPTEIQFLKKEIEYLKETLARNEARLAKINFKKKVSLRF
ncbi:MAG: hypothetical protein HQK67_06620 [Desulfamplus sp.]|nr:hypothetical protein [Desulfamplus sp.]